MAKAASKTKSKSKSKTKAKPKAKAAKRMPLKAAAKRKTSAGAPKAKPASARKKTKPPAKKLVKNGGKHTFVVSHWDEADFESGLRSYANYRDLGIAEATNGAVQAHVIRMLPPCDPAVVSKRHYHDVDFQMIYLLKGWMKGEYDGQEVTMRAGSCWIQPTGIKHTVLDYSDDCEMLEIILPAEFDTVEL